MYVRYYHPREKRFPLWNSADRMSPGNPRKSLSDSHMPDRACIDSPWIRELSGRGVAVAVIDSGVNPEHPHVSRVAGGVRIVNLSLGTLREDHAGVLEGAVGRLAEAGGVVVVAAEAERRTWWPGSLPSTVGAEGWLGVLHGPPAM